MTPEELRTARNEKLAQQIIKNLEERNMRGYYAADKAEALRIALSLIPEGASVNMGGSMSCAQIGLVDAVRAGNYAFEDRELCKTPEEKQESYRRAYAADVYLGSVNALSEDGVLVNIDGNANRVSAYAWGPAKLVLVVGMNKVAKDTDAAMKRARGEAATINAQRFGLSTPCAKTGKCFDCKSPDSICCQFLITRFSRQKDRIHVILVDENLGF